MTYKYKKLRDRVKFLEVFILILVPFLKIKGKPLLFFDLSTLKLYFLGNVYLIDELHLLLLATISFLLFFILVTLVFGRIWCGWLCPQSVLSDIIERLPVKNVFALNLLAILLSSLVSANLIWYFINPNIFFQKLFEFSALFWFFISITAVTYIFISKFRFDFCAGYCPYAKFQGVLFDDSTLTVTYDKIRGEKECIDDKKCVRVCPVKIDIREGLQIECIQCALCIDACSTVMSKFNKNTLVDYSYGYVRNLKERKIIALLAITIIFFLLTVFALINRPAFHLTVTEIKKTSGIENTIMLYLTIENKKDEEEEIEITSLNGKIENSLDKIVIEGSKLVRISIQLKIPKGSNSAIIQLTSRDGKSKIVKEVSF